MESKSFFSSQNSCIELVPRLTGHSAMLCYICAGDLEKLVECWLKKNKDTGSGPR